MNRKILKFSFSLKPFQIQDPGELIMNITNESPSITILTQDSSNCAEQVSLSCNRKIVNFVISLELFRVWIELQQRLYLICDIWFSIPLALDDPWTR